MNIKLPALFIAILILTTNLWAQQVPSQMEFANMDLRLTSDGIKDIQTDVDALTRSEKYFQKKLERVDMYMPIIERIFREEGLPDDFKYLVIQESALVSDAVSSSNAVGFWQFKEISGLENNLRIDRHIDERMNIVSSTRAAASYLKSHNEYFNNWAYALIAYQRGRGGAADVIDEDNFGKSRLKITNDTYWYLKKFLAHKVAFENALGTSKPPYYLKEIDNVKGTSLKAISADENVPLELLEEYNKWILKGKIPEDKNYTVIVPLKNIEKIEKLQNQQRTALKDVPGNINDNQQQNFPLVDNYPSKSDRSIPHEVEINGLDGIYAPAGYTVQKLAETAGIDEYKFRKWNDLKIREELKTGKIYYLRRKRNRAKFYYHTVSQAENMWEISQKYGIKLKKLYRKNRMAPPQEPEIGRVLWLRQNRPADVPIEFRETPIRENPKKIPIEVKNEISQPSDLSEIKSEMITKNEEVKQQKEILDTVSLSETTIIVDSTSAFATKNPVNDEVLETQIDSLDAKESMILVDDSIKLEEPEIVIEEEEIESDLEVENELEEISEFDQSEFTEYSITKGDTFFSIANKFNMKISTLLNVNDLGIRDTLSIGQVIKVNKDGYVIDSSKDVIEKELEKSNDHEKSTSEKVDKNIEHRVTSGETMYALAKKYNVSVKEILEWNNKEDYNLKEGEIIVIKQK